VILRLAAQLLRSARTGYRRALHAAIRYTREGAACASIGHDPVEERWTAAGETLDGVPCTASGRLVRCRCCNTVLAVYCFAKGTGTQAPNGRRGGGAGGR
jgi:hypothetical protein